MKNKEFMEQRVKDMTALELLDAVKHKLIPKLEELKKQLQKREVEVGDTVRIIEDWKNNWQSSKRVGKIGKVTELISEGGYRYVVKCDGDETVEGFMCYKVELVAKKGEEKKQKKNIKLVKRTEKERVAYLFSKYMSNGITLEHLKIHLKAVGIRGEL